MILLNLMLECKDSWLKGQSSFLRNSFIINHRQKRSARPLMARNSSKQRNLMSYLLLAHTDQEDDEDDEHNSTQTHNNEREVGHQNRDQQQLLHSGRRCIIDHHALCIRRECITHVKYGAWMMDGLAFYHVTKLSCLWLRKCVFLKCCILIPKNSQRTFINQA